MKWIIGRRVDPAQVGRYMVVMSAGYTLYILGVLALRNIASSGTLQIAMSIVSVAATWQLHRAWTFRARAWRTHTNLTRQASLYVASCAVSFIVINLGLVASIQLRPATAGLRYMVAVLTACSAIGITVLYVLCNRFVFPAEECHA